MMARRLRRWVLFVSVCLLIAPLLLSCGSVDDGDLMAGAIPPPDQISGNATIQYLTEEGEVISVTVIEGQVIVLFDLTVSEDTAEGLIVSNGGTIIAKIPSIRYYLAGVASGNEMEFINAMREEPGLNLAIPNVPLGNCQIEPPDEWDDADWYFSWHLKEIKADLAWELLRDVSLSEKRIVFIDQFGGFNGFSSGLGDFQGRIVGTGPVEVPLLPSEGHGTKVAAVAAAMGNNDFGNVGVNWNTKISAQWAYTVIDVPFEVCTAIAGGADVISLSLGVPTCFGMQEFYLDPLFGVVNAAKAIAPGKKFVVVQAAGNDGCELVSYASPSYNPKPDNLILVGATLVGGSKWDGSNFGDEIDIAAPGGFSVYYYSTGTVESEAGTSFAAPLVSGTAALVWAKESDLTPQQVVQRLKETAQPFDNLEEQYEGKFGAGILDVYRALDPEGMSAVLTISSTAGGFVATPGEGTFLRDAGTVVDLVATPDPGYSFVNWTGDVSNIGNVNSASTTITMNGDYSIMANFIEGLVETPELEWDKTFGGIGDEVPYSSIRQTPDGGYIIAGSTKSYGAGLEDIWLIKTDSSGNKVWDKTFGGTEADGALSIQLTPDGGYIVAGFTKSYGVGLEDIWLIKTDSSGNKVWDKTFGGTGSEGAWSVQLTSDNGYIIAGTVSPYEIGEAAIWLIKTDSEGNKVWDKAFGGQDSEVPCSVRQTSDGGYIIAGSEDCEGTCAAHVWLIKTDSSGNKVWDKTFGGTEEDIAYSVEQTSDAGYIIAGVKGTWKPDAWLIKTDSSGNKVWDKTFGGTEADGATAVQQTSDGGYILAGGTETYGAGAMDVWLIKTDSSGNKVWDKTFGGTENEWAWSVQLTSDGGYILAGGTESYGAGNSDIWLLKVG